MTRRDVTIDEVFPVFTLTDPVEESMWTVDIPDELYKEYVWTMYKYYEFQTKLQVYYEQCQRAEFESAKDSLRSNLQQNPNCIHGAS